MVVSSWSLMEPHCEAAPMEPCRICGGRLDLAFEGTVLDTVPVHYARCLECHSLLLPSPTWLDEAYTRKIVPDPDFGALTRTLFVHRCLRRLRSKTIGLLPRRSRTLDIGTGRGLLLRMLLDDGHDAWGFDPYPHSVFAEDRIQTSLPEGPFAAITAIEVLEHTLDPVEVLKSLHNRLAPDGFLALSTELYDASTHGPNWAYLAPVHGQHITLFSREGLHRAARAAGFRWIRSLHWGGQPFLHLLTPADAPTSSFRLWMLELRHRAGEQRHRRDSRA
jgi:SAM-dependent methyltransferase